MSYFTLLLGGLALVVILITARELYLYAIYGPPAGVRSPPTLIPILGHGIQILRGGPSRHAFLEAWSREYGGERKIMMARLPFAEKGYAYLISDPKVCVGLRGREGGSQAEALRKKETNALLVFSLRDAAMITLRTPTSH